MKYYIDRENDLWKINEEENEIWLLYVNTIRKDSSYFHKWFKVNYLYDLKETIDFYTNKYELRELTEEQFLIELI